MKHMFIKSMAIAATLMLAWNCSDESSSNPAQTANDSTIILHCKEAKGFVSASGFVVQRGSRVSDHTAPSFEPQAHSFYKLRERLIEDEIIDSHYCFTNDYEFSSPSAAAAVVLGRSANGLTAWRTEDGKKLKEL